MSDAHHGEKKKLSEKVWSTAGQVVLVGLGVVVICWLVLMFVPEITTVIKRLVYEFAEFTKALSRLFMVILPPLVFVLVFWLFSEEFKKKTEKKKTEEKKTEEKKTEEKH